MSDHFRRLQRQLQSAKDTMQHLKGEQQELRAMLRFLRNRIKELTGLSEAEIQQYVDAYRKRQAEAEAKAND